LAYVGENRDLAENARAPTRSNPAGSMELLISERGKGSRPTDRFGADAAAAFLTDRKLNDVQI